MATLNTVQGFTTQARNWKSGQASQIKAIRAALLNTGELGGTLAAALTDLCQQKKSPFVKGDIRSFNSAMQRECKRQNKAAKIDIGTVYGLEFDAESNSVKFGLAKEAKPVKVDAFKSCVAKFIQSGGYTDANKKIAITLLEGMMREDA